MNKTLPQNIEAEEAVLGSLIIDNESIIKVADFLSPNDFYKSSNSKIFDTILELYRKNEPIDILSLTNKLKDKNYLKEIGGISFITTLVNRVPTSMNIVSYAKIIREKKILRELISVSNYVSNLGFQEDRDIDDLLDDAEQRIFNITQKSLSGKLFKDVSNDIDSILNKIDRLRNGDESLIGVKTGFNGLDNILSGMQKSDLIILAARPSLGKTSLSLNIALNAARNIPVGIFSLEMSREQLSERLLSMHSGIDLWKIRTGNIEKDSEEEKKLKLSGKELSSLPIYIDDSSSSNIINIRTMARKLQSDHGLGLIIVDYLQLINPREKSEGNMVQQITEISRGLKCLAKELNIPIIAVSQLSRAVEQREYKIPKLSDLRESGSIEQDADVVMFIYRKDRERINADIPESEKNIAKIIIAKHRNGSIGDTDLRFIPTLASFEQM